MNVTITPSELYTINIDGVEYEGMKFVSIYVAKDILVYEHPTTMKRIVLKEKQRISIDDAYESPYTVVVNELA